MNKPLLCAAFLTGVFAITATVSAQSVSSLSVTTGNFSSGIWNSSGNVGIGTTAPGYRLDVQGGQINSSGGYCMNGINCITSWPSGAGSTISAGNVSSGSFGANTGGGTYSFPNNVIIGTTGSAASTRTVTILNSGASQASYGSYPGSWTSAFQIQSSDATPRFLWIAPLDSNSGSNARIMAGNTGLDIYTNGSTASNGTFGLSVSSGNVTVGGNLYLTNSNSYLQQAGGFNTYTSGSSFLNTNYVVQNPVNQSGFYLQNQAPYNLNFVSGDVSMPYGYAINDTRTGEHSGFLGVPQGSNGGNMNMIFYVGNDGSNQFQFVPFTWDGSNNHLGTPAMTIGAYSGNVNVSGNLSAYGLQGNANVGGTGSAAWFPSGLYSAGTNWIYNQIYTNGSIYDTSGRMNLTPSGNSWFNGGNVGIGTTGPQSLLNVGGVNSSAAIYGQGTLTGIYGYTSGNGQYGVYGYSAGSGGAGLSGWGYYGVLATGTGYDFYGNGNSNFGGYAYAGELYSRDNIYLGYLGNWLSAYVNQGVTNGASPTFGNIYLNYLGWLSNNLNQSVTNGASPTFGNVYFNSYAYMGYTQVSASFGYGGGAVSCPGGDYVLGGGVWPLSDWNEMLADQPNSYSSWNCGGNQSLVCYAVCARMR